MTLDPVPGQRPRPSLDTAPRGASRPFLGHSAKMHRIRLYNRPSRHEHSRRTPPLETARRPLWETRQRSTSRRRSGQGVAAASSRTAPDHLAVIQPPAAPRLTARCRLRTDRLPCPAFARAWWETAAALSADGCLVDTSPLTPFTDGRKRSVSPCVPVARARSRRARQCCRLSRARGAFRRRRPHDLSCESPCGALPAAGRRGQSPHVFIDVR
jgi:hypothetical protein